MTNYVGSELDDENSTDQDGAPLTPEEREKRKRKRRTFEEMSASEQNILKAFLDLFKGLLGAESAAAANGEDTEHDPLFQSLNSQFADTMGMDPAGDDYASFKQKMRTPGYDPAKDRDFVGRVTQSGAVETGGKIDTFVKNPPRELLDLICKHESGGNYNVVWNGCKVKPQNLTGMTVSEVMQWQRDEIARGSRSTAAGRYQIISGTMKGLVREMGLTGNEKFDEALQDRMAMQLLKRRGLDDYLGGRISQDKFMDNMAYEWASLKKSNGRGAYDGDGLNASVNTLTRERAILTALRTGDNFNTASGAAPVLVASATTDTKTLDPNKKTGPALTPGGSNA
jgi:muramidase (phage lysozyme)